MIIFSSLGLPVDNNVRLSGRDGMERKIFVGEHAV